MTLPLGRSIARSPNFNREKVTPLEVDTSALCLSTTVGGENPLVPLYSLSLKQSSLFFALRDPAGASSRDSIAHDA